MSNQKCEHCGSSTVHESLPGRYCSSCDCKIHNYRCSKCGDFGYAITCWKCVLKQQAESISESDKAMIIEAGRIGLVNGVKTLRSYSSFSIPDASMLIEIWLEERAQNGKGNEATN